MLQRLLCSIGEHRTDQGKNARRTICSSTFHHTRRPTHSIHRQCNRIGKNYRNSAALLSHIFLRNACKNEARPALSPHHRSRPPSQDHPSMNVRPGMAKTHTSRLCSIDPNQPHKQVRKNRMIQSLARHPMLFFRVSSRHFLHSDRSLAKTCIMSSLRRSSSAGS